MTNKGKSDGRRPSNCGRGTLPMVYEEPEPTFIGESIPIIPSIVVTPSTLEDSLTPEYPSLHSKHLVDQRSFLQVIDKE
ncbi:hypothetical protein CR513_45025, partial [Mucuna pruriens]